MATSLKGKVALVTGSARGIGKAIALRYAQLGAALAVNYARDEKSAADTVAEITRGGGRAIAVQGDVSNVADIDRLFAATVDRFGGVDVVVANAGLEQVSQRVLEITEADFDRLFSVNTRGTFFTLQRAANYVNDNGRIIYVGSSTTRLPNPGYALYGGSKVAPQYVVEVLAKELGHRGVTVNSILPTAIEGAGAHAGGAQERVREYVRSTRPIARMGTLDDVANAAEYLASELASFVSGQHLLLSGGASA
ncbi:MAG TPA: SDR family oxidoreductase [Polyangiaceae bacterium]